MTVKLLAMFTRPHNEDAFLNYYHLTHLPLVQKVPGLTKAVVNRVNANLMGGEAPYFLIAEMHFANKTAFDAAMASPENRAAGKDRMRFAKGLVTMISVTESDQRAA